jgi:spermidine synthase
VAQVVMFREMLAICRGTEIFFGVVLAAGMGWTALGSLAAGLAARWRRRRDGAQWPGRAWRWAAALFALNGVLLIVQIALARVRLSWWGGVEELTFLSAVGRAGVATGPVAFLCGVEFVLALHAAPAERFTGLYQSDAWGAVLGGLGFTLLIAGQVDPVTLGPALGAVLSLAVLVAGGPRRLLVATAACAVVACFGPGLNRALHTQQWGARYPRYELEETEESRYGHLSVLRHHEVAQHALYMDGGLVAPLPPAGAPVSEVRNRALFVAAQHPSPERVLLVGGALGAFPRELLRTGVARVDALELDPALFALAERYGDPAGDHPRVEFHFADGRRFLKHRAQAGAYDLIHLALPDPLSAFVNRYYTVEFFREARAALGNPGVLITSVTAAANYPGETVGQVSASLLRTLRQVFPQVLVAPGERHTFIACTRPGVVSLDPEVLGRRVAERGIVLPDVEADFRDVLGPYYAARLANVIVTSQVASLRRFLEATEAPGNTDARPITYQYSLLAWNQVVSARTGARDPGIRGGTNALFRSLLGLRVAHGLLFPGLMVLAGAVLWLWQRGRGKRRSGLAPYAVLAAAFATGLFGMAAEVVLLFAFQSVYGYAYAHVGALIAAFMVGLALGARFGARVQRRGGTLPALVLGMVAYCVLLPAVLRALATGCMGWAVSAGFFGLVVAAGCLDGATFPALVTALRQHGSPRPGAWVYAADLAGAGVGALATGALLVPVLGRAAALGWVAAVLAAALLVLLIPGVLFRPARPRLT